VTRSLLRRPGTEGFLTEARAVLTKASRGCARPSVDARDPSQSESASKRTQGGASGRSIAFPPLQPPVTADPQARLSLLKSFLARWPLPSIVAWARERTGADPRSIRGQPVHGLRVGCKGPLSKTAREALVCSRAVSCRVRLPLAEGVALSQSRTASETVRSPATFWRGPFTGLDSAARTPARILVRLTVCRTNLRGPNVTVYRSRPVLSRSLYSSTSDIVLSQTPSAFHLLMVDDRSSIAR